MLSEIKSVNVGGITTACINRFDLAQFIGKYPNQNISNIEPVLIFSANGHSISEANTDPNYMRIMNTADIVHADGQSVVKFSKWIDGENSIPERTATTDMIHDVPSMYDETVKHFLLGGKKEVVEKSAKIMSDKYQNFEVVGTQDGYFSLSDEEAIIDQINISGCQVLWVGLGKPKEQEFCIRNKDRLNVPVIITCGGCYNFITGDYSRAPQWMQNCGIEWVHRVLTNPKKLLYRYLTTNPHAIYCVIKHEITTRRGG